MDENGDCFDNNNDKVARQSDCCNVDPTSEERIELFKPFCRDIVFDEVCAKFVYHIQTETCDRTAVDRTKYYTDATFSQIVGEPVYTSSFVLSAKGECCIAEADFPDNVEACEDPAETETIEYVWDPNSGVSGTCTKTTTIIEGRKVAVVTGEEIIVVEGTVIGPNEEIVSQDECCLNELTEESLASPTAC